MFKARSPHRSSCRRRARNERRPSTEIRLGVDSALGAREMSPTFFVLGKAFASERAPPERCQEASVDTPHLRLTRGAFTDKEPTPHARCGHLPHHTLYVTVDDFCQSHTPKRKPGPHASLCASEVITLSLFARWSRFSSERDFYRYAQTNLTDAFPYLPERSQFNRLVRSHTELMEALFLHLVALLEVRKRPYEALDSSAMPTRDCKRRGHGWLAGQADIGWSNSLGWYEGFSLLTATDPTGVITGFCFGAASTADQQMAETFFAVRTQPNRSLSSVGSISSGPYIADKGFEGAENHRRWRESYGACIIHPPKRNSLKPCSKHLRRWVASIRQIVESAYDKLFNTFGLWRERPHELQGLRARLAARVALHNFCIWLNEQLGRPRLAFADLLGW
jgi:hypothetical protein